MKVVKKKNQHVRMERALTYKSDLDLNSNSCIMLGGVCSSL